MTRLLLDTNVAVWLLLGERRSVTTVAQELLQDEGNDVALSAVSVWEMAIKRSLGKLEIEDRWARELTRLGFDPLPVTAQHAEYVEHLPWHHRDPFDRLLVAQAVLDDRMLVSADRRLSAYDVTVAW